eukprot:TRINITY_DN10573_c1_g1_i4.p1 TRINITY_DN10573_c1_g1~~TRINITY_DN10573_c1_g1_i4.p1  ORF type:complete len:185 (+),score=44.95 TRINITY_DN10573_c1_g1_i4:38-556(+)
MSSPSLRIRLISAKNLFPADINGYSDPYVRIVQGEEKLWKSSVIQKNLNPVWEETATVKLQKPDEKLVVIEMFDEDKLAKDDMIGYTPIDVSLLPRGLEVVCTYQLSFVPHGEVTIGLTAIDFGFEGVSAEQAQAHIQSINAMSVISRQGIHKVRKEVRFALLDELSVNVLS